MLDIYHKEDVRLYGDGNKSDVNPMLDKELKSYFQSLLNIDSLLMNIALSVEHKHMHIQPVPWLASMLRASMVHKAV